MFKTELVTRYIDDKHWEVVSDLVWVDDDTQEVITVPAGFRTDFASVPRIPIIFELVGDCAHKAAVVHDYLYQTHLRSKPAADWILLKAMKDCGIAGWRRWMIYSGVVVGGWVVYYRYKTRQKAFDYDSRGVTLS